jgi:hypothetical protein
VYIREAHASDEWQMDDNIKEDVVIAQPRDGAERTGAASTCSAKLSLSMPVLVDKIDNRVDGLYAGWPERIFVVGRDGKIAYAGKQGPWGFKPEEVADWLKTNIGPPGTKPQP